MSPVRTLLRRLLLPLPATPARRPAGGRLRLEALEDRAVPAILAGDLFPPEPSSTPVLAPPSAPAPVLVVSPDAPARVVSLAGEPLPTDLLVRVCHHTSSDTNPFVLLGIPHDNPAVDNHLLHGDHDDHDHTDLILRLRVAADGTVTGATIQFLATAGWNPAGGTAGAYPYAVGGDGVVTVDGEAALRLLTGLTFDTQGVAGHDACVALARRLGLSLAVSPSGVNPQGPGTGDAEADLIRRVYGLYLGRAAAADEVEHWRGVVRSGGAAAAVASIAGSFEADRVKVAHWYELYLQRRPQGGRRWVG